MHIQTALIKFNRFRFLKNSRVEGGCVGKGEFQRELGEIREGNRDEYNQRMLYTHCQRINNNC